MKSKKLLYLILAIIIVGISVVSVLLIKNHQAKSEKDTTSEILPSTSTEQKGGISKDLSNNKESAATTSSVITTAVTNKDVKTTVNSTKSGSTRSSGSVQTTVYSVQGYYINKEEELLVCLNKERVKAGLSTMTINKTLCENAKIRANELYTRFSHTRPDGSECFKVITVDYTYAGENLAKGNKAAGFDDPATVTTAWMNSPGHRENILRPEFSQAGFACYYYNGIYYWVQLFIG